MKELRISRVKNTPYYEKYRKEQKTMGMIGAMIAAAIIVQFML